MEPEHRPLVAPGAADRDVLGVARLAGINHVSRHDARVSIEGGFRGGELAQRLGVEKPEWRMEVAETFMGAYRFVAERNGA